MTKKLEKVATIGDEVVVRAPKGALYSKALDSTGKVVGKVIKIMGPVKSPYGLVKLRNKESASLDIYMED